jgi:hypothetical protein
MRIVLPPGKPWSWCVMPIERHTSLSGACRSAAFGRLGAAAFAAASAGILLASALPAHAAKSDIVPDWVTAAAGQSVPSYPPETKAVVLLDDIQYKVATDGRAVEHRRRVVKILRPQGRDEGIVQVDFDNDTKILSMGVWSIGPDGHEYAMKPKDFIEVGLGASFVAFGDDRARIARAPAADPGAVIAYEYEQQSRPYLSEKTWWMQSDIPRLHESFTLELPPGFTYGTVWAQHPDMSPADTEGHGIRWEAKNEPAVDLRLIPMSPAAESLAARMTVHYGGPGVAAMDGTWKSVGQWYTPLFRDRVAASPDITARTEQLIAGKTDFYDKVEALGKFVQKDIRYVAIEIGIGGYQPHAAADVFRNRYGDCKDKSALLTSMLSVAGIHATALIVDTERGVVNPAAPSTVGNHAVTAIEIPAGYTSDRLHSVVTSATGRRYLIFDPTWEKIPFGQLEHELQGGYGILMEGNESQLIQLPIMDPQLNTIRRTAVFQLQPDGSLKGSVTEKRFGDVAERRRDLFTSGDARQQREMIDGQLKLDLASFSATDVKIENIDALNLDLTLSYALTADGYAQATGPLLMVRPRVLGRFNIATNREPRRVPIDLTQTMQAVDDYSIELPAGYTVDELPSPIKLDLGFASYQSSSAMEGNILHYNRTYTVRQVTLAPEKYADLQKLAGVIAADEETRAVLKKQ